MLSASLYITLCTARNRVRVRLRRLREPRYLVGAMAGAAYMYFSVFARIRPGGSGARRRRNSGLPVPLRALAGAGPAIGGLVALLVAAIAWLMPFESGLLAFSEAEVAFLFPAPVTRRELLVHRMMRSQLGMLFGALVIGVVSPSSDAVAHVRVAVGTWLVLFTAKAYFTGVTLARSRLRSADRLSRRVAWLPIVFLGGALLAAAAALFREFNGRPVGGFVDVVRRIGGTAGAFPLRVLLWPFTAVAAPLFADSPAAYVAAFLGAGVVLAAVVVWVLLSDEAFQDAAAEAVARREAEQPGGRAVRFKVRPGGPALAPSGRPELALAWKGAMQTLRIVDRRSAIRLVAIGFSLAIAAVSLGRAGGALAVVGVFSAVGAGFAILMGPQAMRLDLRQDLRHLELLKTWPVPAPALVRGEVLWPGTLLTLISWALLGLTLLLSESVFEELRPGLRISGALAIAILAPALIFAQYAIHNGVALLFPAWVSVGASRARGLDAMGQRLIMLGGTWLLLVLMMIPGALAGGIVWFTLESWLGAGIFVPAALAAAIVMVVEVVVATEAMGPLFERVDVSEVEKGE
jgi:ABC-2 type transport system permease protein